MRIGQHDGGVFYFGREEQALFLIRIAQLGYIALILWGWPMLFDFPCHPTDYCTTLILFAFIYAGSILFIPLLLSTYRVEQFIQRMLRAQIISGEKWEREMKSVNIDRLLDEKMPLRWLQRGVSKNEYSSLCYHLRRTQAIKNLKKEYGFVKEPL